MILKKPYAFLIRHFKIIHLLLLVPMGYLIHRSFRVVSFFRTYVQNNYTTSIINIAAEHISFFMYLSVLLVILSVLAIYYLMRQKKKSTKLYFFILLYYIFFFVLIGLTYSVLSSMEHNLITAQTARAYRDISVVLCLPQYFFFLYTLIRGIGFDIKKFNFAGDLKDLEITDIDSEEFEFHVNIEGYKIERTARRFVREMTYYIRENTFVFGCIIAVFVIFIGTVFYLHYGVYNKTYHTSDKMTHNFFTLQVADSMVTNLSYNGNVIADGKYYLVLKLLIENRTTKDYDLDYTNFRLVLNNQNIYPLLDRGEHFVDFGKPYIGEKIKKQSKEYYTLAYEIDSSLLTNEYTIKILESVDFKVGEIAAKYKILKLNPPKIDIVKDVDTLEIGKIINLKQTNLDYSTFQLNNYQFVGNYTYDYEYCKTENNCRRLKDSITPNVSGTIEKTTLLVLNNDFELDKTSDYWDSMKTNTKFASQFLSLRYTKNGKSHLASMYNRTTPFMDHVFVFEIRQEVLDAEQIDLLLTIRDKRYIYRLK